MGSGLSGDADVLTLQQQRVQFLLLQQFQEVRQMRNENGAAAGALSAIGGLMRPAEQPILMTAEVLRNPAHVRGKSIVLMPGHAGESSILRFGFDSLAPCQITVYRSALLVPSPHAAWEVESAAWSSPPVLFPSGLGQVHMVEWEALWLSQAASGTFESDGKHCPLLLELRVEKDADGMPPCTEWTICQLLTARGNSGKTRVEVMSQQFCYSDYQALEALEFFGSELTADGVTRQDCIVCQTEPRDTAVLPCRHLCLCSRCADYIRTRTQYHSYKCPICREKIGRMMRIEVPSEDSEPTIGSESGKDMDDDMIVV